MCCAYRHALISRRATLIPLLTVGDTLTTLSTIRSRKRGQNYLQVDTAGYVGLFLFLLHYVY